MQLYFTTVRRNAPPAEGGSLVRLDWDTQRVLGSVPMAARDPQIRDPKPRGSTRGGRGIVRVGPDLVVASFHTLERFTPDLASLGGVTHPLLAGIHELDPAVDGASVWVAATSLDAALLVDIATGDLLDQRWPRESPGLQHELGLVPLSIDKAADNRATFLSEAALADPGRVHLNAVRLHQGRLLGLLHNLGVIVDLDAGRVVVRHRSLIGAHDLVITEDGLVIVDDTRGAQVRWFDLADGRFVRSIDVRRFSWVRELERSAGAPGRIGRLARRWLGRPVASRPLFVRGLARAAGRLYVGLSPAAIIEIDEASGAFVTGYQHSRDVNDCVHGLYVEP